MHFDRNRSSRYSTNKINMFIEKNFNYVCYNANFWIALFTFCDPDAYCLDYDIRIERRTNKCIRIIVTSNGFSYT